MKSPLKRRALVLAPFLAAVATLLSCATGKNPVASTGLDSRPPAKAFLQMPARADGVFPQRLSQTGAFADTTNLMPAAALIPYDLIVPFWSDGAEKSRWISVPDGEKIKFTATDEWIFPKGTVFVKHFDLATNETHPEQQRRLETRLLVCDADGGVYGATYKWRADNSDADLLATNLTEAITIQTATGIRTQQWYYPSRADCLTCHTANAGYVLGVKTRQLNRDFKYPSSGSAGVSPASPATPGRQDAGAPGLNSGVTNNQLRAWNHLGLFDTNLAEVDLKNFPKLAAANDATRSLADRARSYLDANCANCHRPGGTVAYFDARYDTPLAQQNLIGGRVLIDQRIDGARVIAPNDLWRSILFMRANTTEAFKMPPLARNQVDEQGMKLLRQWIESLPGPPVLPPPEISPRGGNFTNSVEVILRSEPGAAIRYTVDGTVPTTSDPLYEKPIRLTGSAILRAKAFKSGCTKSITAQEIFLVGE